MAESLGSLRVSIGLDSAELTRGLDGINKKLEAVNSEFKATMAGAGRFDNSLDALNQKANVLNRTMQVHTSKLSELKRRYEESVRVKGKDNDASVRLLTQYNKALAAMRKTEDQLDLVNKRIREQSTGFAQLGAKLNASVNTITTKMRALDAAFKATTAGVDNFGSTSDQLRQKADHLNKSIDLQQQRLKDLRRLYLEAKRAKGEDAQETQELSARMNEATAQLRETQAQLRATNTQIEQQANAWHRMGTQAQESGENLRTIGGKLQSIGSEIATSFGVATLAISGALGLATKKSMDFEQQMSNVKSVMDPAEANKYSDALTNLAVKLGADTKYSALEAAQGMEELVKAGVSTKDIMGGGLSGALSLATAGDLELADAAEIASTALNAFKDDNLSVAKAADILAGAANASATSVGEMKYGLSMTSAVAAGMGLSFKDTSTALAVFAQNGLKGSDAGTSLKTMLSRLVPMTDGAYTTMESLGLVSLDTKKAFESLAKQGFKPASQDLGDIYKAMDAYVTKTTGLKKGTASFEKAFSKASIALGVMDNKFFDAQGNIKSMTEISGELSKALDGMSAKDKQEALYKIFGSDAIRGALILGKSGAKGFTEMANAMDKIKAADVAAERMNNLKGRIEELSGAFETAQINVGKALTPAVSALVAVLQKVVDAFNNLSPGMQKFVAITLAVTAAILGVVTVLGVLLAGIGGALVGLGSLQIAWGLLSVQIAAAGGMMGVFTSILAALTSPIALTIAGITALVTVFVLVYKHSEQLQKLLGVVFNGIKSGALVAYNGAKVAFDGIIAAVDRMSAYLLEKGPAMWNGFAAGAVNIGDAIQSGFNSAIAAIGSFFYSLGQKASEFFGQGVAAKVADAAGIFFAQLKTAFSSVSGVISIVAPAITGFGLALAGVSGPIGFAITALVSLSGFLFRLYQSNEQFRNSVTTVWSQVSSAISSAMMALKPVFDAFSQYFGEIAAELAPEFAETMNVMVTSLATLKPAFAELGAAIAELGPSFAQLGATFASLAGELGIAFSDAVVQITPLLGELASAFTQMLPGIISLVSGLLNIWVQVQGTLLQVITSIVTTVLPILVEGFTSLLPIVLNVVQAVFPVILSLIQAITPVIQMIATTVLPVLLSAVQAIFPVVLAVVKAVMPFVATIIQLVASVIKDLVINVLPLILEVVKAVFPLIVPIIQYATQIIIQVLKAAAIIIKTVLIPAVKFILSIVQAVFPVIVSVIRAALNIVTNVIKLFSAVLRGDWKAAWNAVLGILKAIFSPIVKLVTNMGKAISDKWTYVKNKMALLTYEMKKKVMERFNSIVDGAKKLPGRIGDGIKSMAGKAVNGVKSLGNKMIGGFEGIVNGLTQKGINKVLGLVGVDKKHFIPKLEIPRYAKGTAAGGHPGGPAILGDGGGPELFRTPSGFTGLSPGRDTLFNLPKGTQVLPHDMTKKLIAQGIPAFKNGTKKKNLFERGVDAVSGAKDTVVNVAKGAVNKVKDFAFDVWDYVSDPKKLVSKVVNSLGLKLPEISGAFGSLAKGSYEKIKSSMVGFVKKQIDDFGGGFGSGEKATGNVKQWIRKAMAVTKVPSSWFNPLTTIAMKESGGRTGPSTINKWDSNWKRGTPSMGLMQTIRPTFDAYKMKGMGDIMNPVHNAAAAIRYIISRYKTVFNVPGIKSMRAGGPYKGYKIGDIVTQKQLAWVAEEGPEAVIPLKNNRQRALQLYKETGKKLGVESGTDQTVVANLLERLVSVEQRSLATLNIIAQKDPSVRVDKDALTNYVDSSQAQQATMKRLFRGDR
ncbi:phage tail tape measure protein [Bacillus amyloliquefaciens]|uniref:phage tail tape measure protein n=1 Tax=Bacillus amyloliquefaciens TaxID=1390 RepID=UPI00228078E8|nr:phage tail tape measure protein [Bacillus amyloliquefaciens]MCY7423543.1 phage tail tape measure protein [Bacillus amyloliquefaciens]MEC0966150.1 phage tail tape measure protein [Bacillus amyloliquefaciens]MEC1012950.1 phage tail tape measure protein [Bacillus amyloliquefaciens]